MPKAICRFDVEALGVGLKNEIEIESVCDNSLSGTNVFSLLVGKIYNTKTISAFKHDKENGNTDYLDLVMKESCVELGRYDENGEHFTCIYVPYDITDNLSFKTTFSRKPSVYENCVIELEFECDGNRKFIYVSSDELGISIYTFMNEALDDFLCDAARDNKCGLRYVNQDFESDEFDWYGEIEVTFFDPAGYNVDLSFEHVAELCEHLVSVRYVKWWNLRFRLLKRFFHAKMCRFLV